MKLRQPPEWMTNLKDWLYAGSVIIAVPLTFFGYLLSNLEAKQFGLKYLMENFASAILIGVIVSIVVGFIVIVFKIINIVLKRKK